MLVHIIQMKLEGGGRLADQVWKVWHNGCSSDIGYKLPY